MINKNVLNIKNLSEREILYERRENKLEIDEAKYHRLFHLIHYDISPICML